MDRVPEGKECFAIFPRLDWFSRCDSQMNSLLTSRIGGGYVNPAHPKHVEMLGELVKSAKKKGKDFSVFAVEYG
jgi:hypothetical protein